MTKKQKLELINNSGYKNPFELIIKTKSDPKAELIFMVTRDGEGSVARCYWFLRTWALKFSQTSFVEKDPVVIARAVRILRENNPTPNEEEFWEKCSETFIDEEEPKIEGDTESPITWIGAFDAEGWRKNPDGSYTAKKPSDIPTNQK